MKQAPALPLDGRWTLLSETRPGQMHLRCSATNRAGWLYLALIVPGSVILGIHEVTRKGGRPLNADGVAWLLLLAAVLLFTVLHLLVNRVHVVVNGYDLVVKTGPLPWWTQVNYTLYGVTRVQVSISHHRGFPSKLALGHLDVDLHRVPLGPFPALDFERAAAHVRQALPLGPDGKPRPEA